MSSQWRSLRLSQKGTPPLLFQYTWTRKGYELYVTDLTSIWSERLSHGQIVKRAEETAATVDPSEGLEQLEVLLSKIEDALRADGGHAGSHAILSKGSSVGSLELTTSTELPSPLKPLRWPLYLTQEPPSSLTGHLLLPLLKDESRWETDRRFLLDQIKQKDWVLGKLFDKFEALSIELGTVFPAATGLRISRKGSTRAQAANLIKGIAPFDEQCWLAESQKSSTGTSGLAASIVHETIGSTRDLDLEKLQPPKDQWWNDLQRRAEPSLPQEEPQAATEVPHDARASEHAAPPDMDLDKDGESTAESEDDEFQVSETGCIHSRILLIFFQRQETPPQLRNRDKKPAKSLPVSKAKKQSPPPQPPAKEADQTTASKSEPGPIPRRTRTPSIPPKPRQPSPKPQTKEPSKKPKGGLGVIGGKKKKEEKPPQRTPSPPPSRSPNPTVETEPSHQLSPKAKRPTKLGMIGGKSKAKVPVRAEKPPAQAEPGTPSPKGVRGGPTSEADSETARPTPKKESPIAGRPAAAAVPEQAPETEKERADRRREELKRQLEAKSNAPTKKKRRF